MTLSREHPTVAPGLLFHHDELGRSGCPGCGWSGASPLLGGARQDACPACEVPETHAGDGREHRVAAPEDVYGRGPWARLAPGDFYRPGAVVIAFPKLGRNEPCHCGSGKKWKRCHGAAA